MKYKQIQSNIGSILLLASDKGLSGLWFENQRYHPGIHKTWLRQDNQILLDAENQLSSYFKQDQKNLKINLDLDGTPFQLKVWNQLLKIPYGQTVSYSTIASRIGQPKACRAVGRAIGQNPISLFVPCHRVISSNGKLTGYAGGINRKQFLLKLQSS